MRLLCVVVAFFAGLGTVAVAATQEQELKRLLLLSANADQCSLDLNPTTRKWLGAMTKGMLLSDIYDLQMPAFDAYDAAKDSGSRVAYCSSVREKLAVEGWL